VGRAKTGPKPIPISKHQFEDLCGLMCTLVEIAHFFDCSEDTIERWCKRTYDKTFKEAYSIYREKGRVSLRRKQMALAKQNAAMAIFLGKNYLGQSDKVEAEVDTNITVKIDYGTEPTS
jgi:hypothetical protein